MREKFIVRLIYTIVISLHFFGKLLIHPRIKHDTSIRISLIIPTKNHKKLISRWVTAFRNNPIAPIHSDIVDRTN